jgi:hypothetical protein
LTTSVWKLAVVTARTDVLMRPEIGLGEVYFNRIARHANLSNP